MVIDTGVGDHVTPEYLKESGMKLLYVALVKKVGLVDVKANKEIYDIAFVRARSDAEATSLIRNYDWPQDWYKHGKSKTLIIKLELFSESASRCMVREFPETSERSDTDGGSKAESSKGKRIRKRGHTTESRTRPGISSTRRRKRQKDSVDTGNVKTGARIRKSGSKATSPAPTTGGKRIRKKTGSKDKTSSILGDFVPSTQEDIERYTKLAKEAKSRKKRRVRRSA